MGLFFLLVLRVPVSFSLFAREQGKVSPAVSVFEKRVLFKQESTAVPPHTRDTWSIKRVPLCL